MWLSYLSYTQDLAPCFRRLPGFAGPVPPPLLISRYEIKKASLSPTRRHVRIFVIDVSITTLQCRLAQDLRANSLPCLLISALKL